MCHRPDGRMILEFDGKPFRRLEPNSWDATQRLADMDRDGIAVQIVSPMPELFSYGFDASKSAALCEHVNGSVAELVSHEPQRFAGIGIVTMQDIELAVRQVSELRSRYGLIGIEIGSNIGGFYAGNPLYHPVYEAAAAQGLLVFVHAFHPLSAGVGGLDPKWTPFAGFMNDIGAAALSFIEQDVTGKYPSLKILFSHGGGTLSSLMGRLEKGFAATKGYGGMTRSPRTIANDFLYDSNVYDPQLLSYLATHFAPGRFMLGTDYPYDIGQKKPLSFLDQAGPAGAGIDVVGASLLKTF